MPTAIFLLQEKDCKEKAEIVQNAEKCFLSGKSEKGGDRIDIFVV